MDMSINGGAAASAPNGVVQYDLLANRRCLSTADYDVVKKHTTANTRGSWTSR